MTQDQTRAENTHGRQTRQYKTKLQKDKPNHRFRQRVISGTELSTTNDNQRAWHTPDKTRQDTTGAGKQTKTSLGTAGKGKGRKRHGTETGQTDGRNTRTGIETLVQTTEDIDQRELKVGQGNGEKAYAWVIGLF